MAGGITEFTRFITGGGSQYTLWGAVCLDTGALYFSR